MVISETSFENVMIVKDVEPLTFKWNNMSKHCFHFKTSQTKSKHYNVTLYSISYLYFLFGCFRWSLSSMNKLLKI